MKLRRQLQIGFATVCLALGTWALWAWPRAAETRFTSSDDPSKLVLFVSVIAPQAGTNRSMTLYGDGRLELTLFGRERQLLREQIFSLQPPEIEALLAIAAEHDLPAYDAEEMLHRWRSAPQTAVPAEPDSGEGEITLVSLALESYSKEGLTYGEPFYKTIRQPALQTALRRHPEFSEYRGLLLLREQLDAFCRKAGWRLLADGSVTENGNGAAASSTAFHAGFTYSTDPTEVVLDVVWMAQTVNQAMTLYGDGRLTVARFGVIPKIVDGRRTTSQYGLEQRKIFEEKSFTLSPAETEDLLRIAVDHGLAEYDEPSVHARQLRGGMTALLAPGIIDGGVSVVSLSLESYHRNGHERMSLHKEIRLQVPPKARQRFPDIPEYQGVLLLQEKKTDYWRRAGWPVW